MDFKLLLVEDSDLADFKHDMQDAFGLIKKAKERKGFKSKWSASSDEQDLQRS